MNVATALSILSALLGQSSGLSTLIAKAIADGNRDITAEELAALQLGDDSARTSLDAAIAAARAGGN